MTTDGGWWAALALALLLLWDSIALGYYRHEYEPALMAAISGIAVLALIWRSHDYK